MPASFLCDRATTIVAKEQPGFCNFIVLPIWSLVSTVMPEMLRPYERSQSNVIKWKAYEETEEDK